MTETKLDINNSNILVYGVGIKGMEYPAKKNREFLKEYSVWLSLLYRCTKDYWSNKPTYTGTTCSENFKSYTFFYEWCNKQVGFRGVDEQGRSWHLDKDLLIKGNKHYSEDTCCFVPQRINMLFTKRGSSRGEYPVGVTWRKGNNKFVANCNNGSGKYVHLGCFQTQREAFLAYKTFKEKLIKQTAEEYKEQIDPRAYTALINYKVDAND